MTEAEWLASEDPGPMLHYLTHEVHRAEDAIGDHPRERPLISPRKLRLFAVACCRQVWDRLADERSRRAVEVAERYADGEATEEELRAAFTDAIAVARLASPGIDLIASATAAHATSVPLVPRSRLSVQERDLPGLSLSLQAHLLRDIAGNPWHRYDRPVNQDEREGVWRHNPDHTCEHVITPAMLTPTVRAIAQAAYQERGRKCERCRGQGEIITLGQYGQRQHTPCPDCKYTGRIDDGTLDPARLAVLSDALEEAGCTEEAILRHLRGERLCADCLGHGYTIRPGRFMATCLSCQGEKWIPLRGPHVRGCWVLDLLLGKE